MLDDITTHRCTLENVSHYLTVTSVTTVTFQLVSYYLFNPTFILKVWPQSDIRGCSALEVWSQQPLVDVKGHHTHCTLSICRCSVGYYGNPSLPGGVCSRCSCSGWGSLQPLCDTLSGQCDCKAGIKGQSCDQCDERHILHGGECVCE